MLCTTFEKMKSCKVSLYLWPQLYNISYPLFVPRIWKGTHLKESIFPEAEGRFVKVFFRILGTNNE